MGAHLDEMKREAQTRGATLETVKREFEGDLDMVTAAEHQRYEDDMAELEDMREYEAGEMVEAIEDGRQTLDDVWEYILEGETDSVNQLVHGMEVLVAAKTDAEQFHASTLVRKALVDAAWDFAYSQAEDLTLFDMRERRRESREIGNG